GPGTTGQLARGGPHPGRLQRRPGYRRPDGGPGRPGRPEGRQGARLDRAGARISRRPSGRRRRQDQRGAAVTDTLTPVLTAYWDQPDQFTIDGYRRSGGWEALPKALAMP